ncbi:hypothetical protein Tco_0359655 [Tanacetum coccineum]
MVEPSTKANRPNQVVANNGGQGRGNKGNQARGRAFMLGAEEVRQAPNIVTDFVDVLDASGLDLGLCVDAERGKRQWIELFSHYDYEIHSHPSKVNVVADALSKKERIKPRRIRAMNMTLQLSIKDKISGRGI